MKKVLFNYEQNIRGALITNRMNSIFIPCQSYNDYLRKNYYYDVDILKLLTGDDEYMRIDKTFISK